MGRRTLIWGRGCLGRSNTSTYLVEAEVEGVLDDARHELRRDEVRELWRESCQELLPVRLRDRVEAARGLYFLKVGVHPVSIVLSPVGRVLTYRENRTATKQDRPQIAVPTIDCLLHQCFSSEFWGVRICARLEERVYNGRVLPTRL